MKNLKIFFAVCLTIMSSCAFAGTFKIIDIAPKDTIRIGSKLCGVNDVFSDNDVIYWDASLSNQAIRVICVQPECKNMVGYSMNMSKTQFRKHAGGNISYNKLISLVSKGDEVKEPLVLWKNDTIDLGIIAEDNCIYYCRVKGMSIKEPLIEQNQSLRLESNILLRYSYKGNFMIDIIKTSKDNPFDTQTISTIEIEAIRKR